MSCDFIPKQFYAHDYHEFKNQFISFLKKKNLNSIFILTDGVFKKSFLNSEQNIIDLFVKDLLIHFKIIHVDLSKACNVSPLEIHASENFLEKTKQTISAIDDKVTSFVALGSGAITDLLKQALHLTKEGNCSFISIPTALTVTAYTSFFSVIDTHGAKRTRPSKSVDATFWIEPLLQAAPMNLSRAGYGDLLAYFTATADWYLGYQLGITEKYDETAHHMMTDFSTVLKNSAEDVGQEKLSSYAIKNISQALGMAGIAMSVAGETTPLSGYEHAISHALDFLHLSSQKNLVLHGEQVALATLSSCTSFDWLLEQESFDTKNFRCLNETNIEKIILKMLRHFDFNLEKSLPIFKHDYLIKNQKWIEAQTKSFPQFLDRWPKIKEHLKTLVMPANEMETLLKKAGLPCAPESTVPATTAQEYRWAIRFSPFVRNRFCLSDFLFWTGEDPCFIALI
jgi:glycerol-1-phosphate dehydrogenase [NAD(P)+]